MVNQTADSEQVLMARQRLLAALSTDSGLRARLPTEPAQVLASYGLPVESAAAWLALLPTITRFARSLISKRRNEARPWIPWTVAALGPTGFRQAFAEYASHALPSGHHKPRHDALGFCAWLLANAGVLEDQIWRREVVTAEHDRLSMRGRRWGCRWRFYRYDIQRWNPESPTSPPPRGVCWLWEWALAGKHGCWRLGWPVAKSA